MSLGRRKVWRYPYKIKGKKNY